MVTQRPFEELNLWQRIFADHWEGFAAGYEKSHGEAVPENWRENVEKMLSCGDTRRDLTVTACPRRGRWSVL